MKQLNYKQVEYALASGQEFKHGDSMHAEYVLGSDLVYKLHNGMNTAQFVDSLTIDPDLNYYVVFSYWTPIYIYSHVGELNWHNPNKYSRTTSRQQNMVKLVDAIVGA